MHFGKFRENLVNIGNENCVCLPENIGCIPLVVGISFLSFPIFTEFSRNLPKSIWTCYLDLLFVTRMPYNTRTILPLHNVCTTNVRVSKSWCPKEDAEFISAECAIFTLGFDDLAFKRSPFREKIHLNIIIVIVIITTLFIVDNTFGTSQFSIWTTWTFIYVTGNTCNQGFHVIPRTIRDFT